ncbi:MAG: ABC transporter ATP-binding protein [Proteobacteria bacterium]|nr:ABC transporter ATP-binding protein [Pseudomonadota bacterium]
MSHSPKQASSLHILISLAWNEHRKLAAAALCMGISALATAGYAYLVGPVLRSLFLGRNDTLFYSPGVGNLSRLAEDIGSLPPAAIGAAIVIAAAVKGASYFGYTTLTGLAGGQILHRLRTRLFRGLLYLNPFSSHGSRRGELIARFTVDAEAVERSIGQGLVAFIRDSLQIFALAGLALALDPYLGIIGLVAFPPVALLIVRIGNRLRKRQGALHSAFGEMSTSVDETVSGLQVIQSFGAEKLMEQRFAKRSYRIFVSSVKAVTVKAVSSPINELLGAGALGLTLWYANSRIAAGSLTPAAFISFFTALFLLYQPIKGIGQAGHAVQSGLAALDRLGKLLELSSPVNRLPVSADDTPPGHRKVLRLKHIEVGYADGPSVLKNVDLTIEQGTKLAIVGKSGTGKSTLLNVLGGFLTPRSGQVVADGYPIDLTPEISRDLFAAVPQEPYLFDDTIRMNVRCGRPEALDAEVEAACRAAGVTPFAHTWPERLDTIAGPGGSNLSVGQRQRVCLARALVSRAPILLLDEVTASLDGETELTLVKQLDRFLADRTVVVVTHRLATAQWADRVAILEHGTISAVDTSASMFEQNQRLLTLFGGQV